MYKLISIRHTRQFRRPSHFIQTQDAIREIFKLLRGDDFLDTLKAFSEQGRVSPLKILWIEAILTKLETTLLKYGKIPVGNRVNHAVYFKPALSQPLASFIRDNLPFLPQASPSVVYLLHLLDGDTVVFDAKNTLDLGLLNMTLRVRGDGTYEEHLEAFRAPPADRAVNRMIISPDRNEDDAHEGTYRTITEKEIPSFRKLDKRMQLCFKTVLEKIDLLANYFNSNPVPNSMKKLPVNVYTAQRKLSELYVASERKPNSLTGEELLHTFKVDAYPRAVIEAVTLSGLAPILRHQEEKQIRRISRALHGPSLTGTYLNRQLTSPLRSSEQVKVKEMRHERLRLEFKENILKLAGYNLKFFKRDINDKPQQRGEFEKQGKEIIALFENIYHLKCKSKGKWQSTFNEALVGNPEAKDALTPYFFGTYSQISKNKSKLKSYFGI